MKFGFLPPRLTNAGLSFLDIIPPKTDPSHKVALLATLEKTLREGVRPFLRRASNIQHNFSKTWIFANCPRIKLPKFAHFCQAVSTLDDTPWNYQIITWSRNIFKVPNIKDKDDVSLLFCQEYKHPWCTFTALNKVVVYKNCMPIQYFQWYVCPYLLLYGLSAIGIRLHGSMGFIGKEWGDWIDGWYPLYCEDHYRTYGAKKWGISPAEKERGSVEPCET